MGHNLTLPFAHKENFGSNIIKLYPSKLSSFHKPNSHMENIFTLIFLFDFSNFESCDITSNQMGRVYYMVIATIMEMKIWLIRFLCAHGIDYHV